MTGFEFIGRIDDVRIADHALTQDQIQTDMVTPLAGVSPPADTIAADRLAHIPSNDCVAGTVTVCRQRRPTTVGVAGVQFLLDNASLGTEDTTSPYSISWNTTTATNGTHTLAAQARDAAGNTHRRRQSQSPSTIRLPPARSSSIAEQPPPTPRTVTLTLSATDALSGVTQMRFSKTGTSFSTAENLRHDQGMDALDRRRHQDRLCPVQGCGGQLVRFRSPTRSYSTRRHRPISARTATNITTNSATVTWTTNEPATSQVDYGLTTSYGSTTTLDPALVTAHSVVLTGLAPNTTYNYRVRSIDAAGNERVSANSTFKTAVRADTIAPTVQSINRAGTTPTNAASVSWTVLFSESVTGVDASDFALATTGRQLARRSRSVSGSGNQYTVTANTGTGNGTLGLNLVDNDTILDTSANRLGGTGTGNGNFTGQSYTIDKIAPTVTINQAAGQADPTSTSPINFTVTFSETVTGFTASDISFAGSTASGALSAVVTGTGPTYNVAVSGMTGTGTVVVSVPAGAATDAAGNASLASTSTDNTVAYQYRRYDSADGAIDQSSGHDADERGERVVDGAVQRERDGRGRRGLCPGDHGSVSGATITSVSGSGSQLHGDGEHGDGQRDARPEPGGQRYDHRYQRQSLGRHGFGQWQLHGPELHH